MASDAEFQQDRERYDGAFQWFEMGEAKALAKMIEAALEDGQTFHLRAYEGYSVEGRPTLWFRLYDGGKPHEKSAPCSPPLNQSNPCPPFCP